MKTFFLIFILLASFVSATNISFFEEFPTAENLPKLDQLDFPTKIYLAAPSLKEFQNLTSSLDQPAVYWPTLTKAEGYWISSWSPATALERIFGEIQNRKDQTPLEVMLDLEFPLARELILSEEFDYNKRLIKNFILTAAEYNVTIITIENAWLPGWLQERWGLKYYNQKRIKMFYSSLLRDKLPDFLVDQIYQDIVHQAKTENTALGIGLIAPGIYGDEPIYSPTILDQELAAAKDINEIIIFRLGGLNEEYLNIIKKYSSK